MKTMLKWAACRLPPVWRLGGWLALGLLAACTYKGYIEEPVTIKLTWFSYLAGDDIRQTCAPGSLDRYRFVYNGHYDEQLRSYEVIGKDDGGADLRARAVGASRAHAIIRSPSDVQDPWRWTVSDARLSPHAFAEFEAGLEDSGISRPPPGVMRLLSTEFYWIASGCRAGRFVFNAWRYGTPRYDALTFPESLLSYDDTGIALNPPRPVDPVDRIGTTRPFGRADGDRSDVFVVRVGADGLVGMGPRL